jgi:hypothetical protein
VIELGFLHCIGSENCTHQLDMTRLGFLYCIASENWAHQLFMHQILQLVVTIFGLLNNFQRMILLACKVDRSMKIPIHAMVHFVNKFNACNVQQYNFVFIFDVISNVINGGF